MRTQVFRVRRTPEQFSRQRDALGEIRKKFRKSLKFSESQFYDRCAVSSTPAALKIAESFAR